MAVKTHSQQPADIIADTSHFRKTGKSMCVVIPMLVRRALNWTEGEILLVRAEDNRLVVQPILDAMQQGIEQYEKDFPSHR